MSEKVRRFLAANPNAKAKYVAEQLGVKISLVYAIKYKKKTPSPAVPKAKPVDIDAVHKSNTFSVTVPVPEAVQKELFPEAKADLVNHPPHYKAGGIETIDFIQAKLTREEYIGYLKGSALKYASRIGKKGAPDIDAGKMAWYATKLRDVLNISQ
jgi:hypothetical protein